LSLGVRVEDALMPYGKSFLVLFFKKELLSFFLFPATRVIG